MKRVIASFVILGLIGAAAGLHIWKTLTLSERIVEISKTVYSEYENDNWNEVGAKLSEISGLWDKNRLWACSTLSTREVDEIEISLEQSIVYAEIEAKEDFIGEFKMFCILIDHLPKQEGPSVYELL